MRITKGKLKQIIAEEHAIVYGRRGRTNKARRKVPSKRGKLYESRRRELMIEAWAEREAELIMEFGWLKTGLKNALGAVGSAMGDGVKAAGTFARTAAETAVQKAKDGAAALADMADQGWANLSKEYTKRMADDFKKHIQDELQKMLKIIATDGRKKAEDGKWKPLTSDEAKVTAVTILTTALDGAKAEMLKGVDKTVQSVKELEGMDKAAEKKLQKSDGPEGEGQAAGRVIAYGARALI